MKDSSPNSPTPIYEQKCGCGRTVLAKAGVSCPFCKGHMQQGEETLRKTFDFDDTDLKKSY